MSRCHARRENDQLVCRQCGLAWDVNDPDPPACRENPTGAPPKAPPKAPAPAMSERQQRRARALRHLDAIIAELQAGE